MRQRWCEECMQHGHRKWLWLGTHWTHRLYMKWHIKKTIWRLKRESKNENLH